MPIGSTLSPQDLGVDDGGPDQLLLISLGAWTPFVISRAQYSQSSAPLTVA